MHCHPLDCQAHPWNRLGCHFTKSKEVQVDRKEVGSAVVRGLLQRLVTFGDKMEFEVNWHLALSALRRSQWISTPAFAGATDQNLRRGPLNGKCGTRRGKGGRTATTDRPLFGYCGKMYKQNKPHRNGWVVTPKKGGWWLMVLCLLCVYRCLPHYHPILWCKRFWHRSAGMILWACRDFLCALAMKPRSSVTTMLPANLISSTTLGGELGCSRCDLWSFDAKILFGQAQNRDDTGASWVSCTTWNRFVVYNI